MLALRSRFRRSRVFIWDPECLYSSPLQNGSSHGRIRRDVKRFEKYGSAGPDEIQLRRHIGHHHQSGYYHRLGHPDASQIKHHRGFIGHCPGGQFVRFFRHPHLPGVGAHRQKRSLAFHADKLPYAIICLFDFHNSDNRPAHPPCGCLFSHLGLICIDLYDLHNSKTPKNQPLFCNFCPSYHRRCCSRSKQLHWSFRNHQIPVLTLPFVAQLLTLSGACGEHISGEQSRTSRTVEGSGVEGADPLFPRYAVPRLPKLLFYRFKLASTDSQNSLSGNIACSGVCRGSHWSPLTSSPVASNCPNRMPLNLATARNAEHSISTVRHPSAFRFAMRFLVSRYSPSVVHVLPTLYVTP
jgi:hypothetical protein